MPCPEENVLVGFLHGDLSDGERTTLEDHLDGCPSCSQVVADLARIYEGEKDPWGLTPDAPLLGQTLSGDTSRGAPTLTDEGGYKGPLLTEGAKLGRYVVLHLVGAGGMGVVYAAYDPELDRKIALKLLVSGGPGSNPKVHAENRLRLLREAQVMAKLQHSNVITVHDVGTFEDRVFLAMEFVEGCTLKRWLRHGKHAWTDVLEVFLAAGRGLAAAHAAGLVHRDFKPDNVLLSSGPHEKPTRILVTDFGLARPAHGHTDAFVAVGTQASEPVLSVQLTQTGALVGTPAYMAPEQLAGERIDAWSDQFSFCVALYEGLYGERPFSGRSLAELVANVSEGRVRPPPSDVQIPRWIRQTVLRGLSTDPSKRHPDMETLLARLERDPWRIWRRRVLPMGIATVAGGGVVAAGVYGAGRRPCRDSGRQLEDVWHDERRKAVERAFTAVDVSWTEPTLRAATEALDRWSEEWGEARRQVCRATRAGEQSNALLDARMACLDASGVRFATLIDVFEGADQTTIERALPAIGELTPPADCVTLVPGSALEASSTPLVHEREALARIEALLDAGQYVQASAELERTLEDPGVTSVPVVLAEALLLKGRAQSLSGDAVAAIATLRRAVFLAQANGASRLQARIARKLALVAGDRAGRLDEGELWVEYAAAELSRGASTVREQAELEHVRAILLAARADYPRAIAAFEGALAKLDPHADAARVAGLTDDLGTSLREAGRYDEAVARHREALAQRESLLGPDHPDVARTMGNLAKALQESGLREEAVLLHRDALARRERTLGPDHPDVAMSLASLAGAHYLLGEYERAEPLLLRALEIRERALGPRHKLVGSALGTLGLVRERLGRLEEAAGAHRRALAVKEDAYGKDHPTVALSLNNLANVVNALDRLEESKAIYERAIEIQERSAPEHPDLAVTIANLGNVVSDLGDHEQAISLHRRALALRERVLPAEHPDLVYSLRGLARALMTAERPHEALPVLERAAAFIEIAQVEPAMAAIVRFELAEALWETSTDRARARRLARDARDALRALGGREAEIAAELDAWLAANASTRAAH